jgi:alpha-L-arabinofuranosidase
LFCVNRNLSNDYHATIQVDGFAPTSLAQVKTITAPSIYTVNSDMEPQAVKAVARQIQAGPEFDMVFPHASVVVIELGRKHD